VVVGLFMVFSHFATMVTIVVLHFAGGFAFNEMSTLLGLVGPLFAGYTSVIITFIINQRHQVSHQSRRVNKPYVIIAFTTPTIFVVSLFAVIFIRAYNVGLADFENFKILVAAIEAVFGIYVGQFIYGMFEKSS